MSYEREPELKFQAPPYTILGKKVVGLEVVTYAIMDGEWSEFVKQLDEKDLRKLYN